MILFVNSMMWDRMIMKEGMAMKKERGSKEWGLVVNFEIENN